MWREDLVRNWWGVLLTYDEDPSPATETTDTFHLHETIRKDVRKATDTDREKIEATQSAFLVSHCYHAFGLMKVAYLFCVS